MFKTALLASVLLLCGSFMPGQEKVEKIKLQLVSRTLHKGKSITVKSDVYYRVTGGLMVTHFTSPYDKVVITNANGEYKEYDVKKNEVSLKQGLELSSKNSFFYNFFSGSINDMGLTQIGYRMSNTRIAGKTVISTWVPGEPSKHISKAEIAHENYLPIFTGFFDGAGKPVQKSYYSNYQAVGNIKMPFTVTEIDYVGDKDSVITKRTYSNLKSNADVEDTYLDFKIPANAKMATPLKVPGK